MDYHNKKWMRMNELKIRKQTKIVTIFKLVDETIYV